MSGPIVKLMKEKRTDRLRRQKKTKTENQRDRGIQAGIGRESGGQRGRER